MSRIRTVKPDTFRSETLSEVSLAAERTFIGLWTEVDDEGRIRERPAVINGALWSLRTDHTVRDLEDDLDELQAAGAVDGEAGLICRYEINGTKYIHLPSWKEHQRVNRPTPSRLPACPNCVPERGGVGGQATTGGNGGTETLFDDTGAATGNVRPLVAPERRA